MHPFGTNYGYLRREKDGGPFSSLKDIFEGLKTLHIYMIQNLVDLKA